MSFAMNVVEGSQENLCSVHSLTLVCFNIGWSTGDCGEGFKSHYINKDYQAAAVPVSGELLLKLRLKFSIFCSGSVSEIVAVTMTKLILKLSLRSSRMLGNEWRQGTMNEEKAGQTLVGVLELLDAIGGCRRSCSAVLLAVINQELNNL